MATSGGQDNLYVAVMVATLTGNIPLNNIAYQTALDTISIVDAKYLREQFKNKWNTLNWIRVFSSAVSFIFHVIACITNKN